MIHQQLHMSKVTLQGGRVQDDRLSARGYTQPVIEMLIYLSLFLWMLSLLLSLLVSVADHDFSNNLLGLALDDLKSSHMNSDDLPVTLLTYISFYMSRCAPLIAGIAAAVIAVWISSAIASGGLIASLRDRGRTQRVAGDSTPRSEDAKKSKMGIHRAIRSGMIALLFILAGLLLLGEVSARLGGFAAQPGLGMPFSDDSPYQESSHVGDWNVCKALMHLISLYAMGPPRHLISFDALALMLLTLLYTGYLNLSIGHLRATSYCRCFLRRFAARLFLVSLPRSLVGLTRRFDPTPISLAGSTTTQHIAQDSIEDLKRCSMNSVTYEQRSRMATWLRRNVFSIYRLAAAVVVWMPSSISLAKLLATLLSHDRILVDEALPILFCALSSGAGLTLTLLLIWSVWLEQLKRGEVLGRLRADISVCRADATAHSQSCGAVLSRASELGEAERSSLHDGDVPLREHQWSHLDYLYWQMLIERTIVGSIFIWSLSPSLGSYSAQSSHGLAAFYPVASWLLSATVRLAALVWLIDWSLWWPARFKGVNRRSLYYDDGCAMCRGAVSIVRSVPSARWHLIGSSELRENAKRRPSSSEAFPHGSILAEDEEGNCHEGFEAVGFVLKTLGGFYKCTGSVLLLVSRCFPLASRKLYSHIAAKRKACDMSSDE